MKFRKSKNIGGLRLNFTQNGIGTSFGVKGARLSVNSNGKVERTLSVPGTGLYDRKTIKNTNDKKGVKTMGEKNVCKKCGAEMPDGAISCAKCGEFFGSSQPQKANKKGLILPIAIVGIGAVLLFSIFSGKGDNKPETSDTSSTVSISETSEVSSVESTITESPKETKSQTSSKTQTKSKVESKKQTSTPKAKVSSETKTTQPPASKPTQTTTPISVVSDLSFSRNEIATVSIKAAPNTEYRISVYYSSGASSAAGLEPKTSDANGNVSWSWKIGGKTNPGTYNLNITGGGEKITKKFTVN